VYRILLAATMVTVAAPSLLGAQDTLVVHSDGPPAWGPAPRLVEDLRIGGLEGAEEEMFGSVGAVVVTDGGTMVIADTQVPALRLFSSNGTYLGDAGREGEGPGEYRSLAGVRPHSEGFAVWDPQNARVSVFDEAGAFLRSLRVSSGLYTADPFQVDSAGTFYVKSSGWTDPVTGAVSGNAWLVVGPEGEVRGAIPIPEAEAEGPSFVISAREGPLRPFTVQSYAVLSPHGYRVDGRSHIYALHRPMDDGRVLSIERTYTPLRPTKGEREQWERWIDFTEEATGARYGPLPDRKPAFHDFRVDDDGRIWVRRHVPATEAPNRPRSTSGRPPLTWREPTTFDVFSPDGRFLGTLTFPARTRFQTSRGLNVWATVAGGYGEAYVVRFRIEPGGS
jgi:hypothetical protein